MAIKIRYDLTSPEVAVAMFRDWCLKMDIIPEHASIEILDRFGKFLSGEGYTSDEIQDCKVVVFANL
ncbi:MAG: hypothetical protein M0Z41_04510 [Peptococcaceae bacterium]|nr:hypothetical protein [Peptococcaceae bacterium]